MPLQSSGQAISFRAEVLEGDGSLCPPLIGNPSLRQLNATIYSNYFENGDGLLTVGMRERYPEEQQVTMFRLLLTDSGHYISTTDDEGAAPLPRQDKIKKEVMWFNSQVHQQCIKQWSDVRARLFCSTRQHATWSSPSARSCGTKDRFNGID